MDSEEKSYVLPGMIMLALVFILIGSFFVVPRLKQRKQYARGEKTGFVKRLHEFAYADEQSRGPKDRSDLRIGINPANRLDIDEDSIMRDWKEDNFGVPNKIVRPTDALGMAKRSSAMSTLRNYFTAEMQHYAEHMKFTRNRDSLYLNFRDPEPYKIEIYVFSNDSMLIMAKGNIDNDEELDVLQIDRNGLIEIINNDLAD